MAGDQKDYGRDPSKREFRRQSLTFIQNTFPNYGALRVLCLAGADLWEYNEIYSHLPRMREKNLTVVERNKLNARLIKASLPNAEVYAGELLDYVNQTDKKFDVISLDFCSEFTPQIAEILKAIRHRELLADKGVIILAVSGQREKKAAKKEMHDTLAMAMLHGTPEQTAEAHMYDYKVPDELSHRNLKRIRGDVISHYLTCTFLGGSELIYLKWVAEQGNDKLIRRIEDMAFRKYAELNLKANGEAMRDKYGIEVEPVQGDFVEAFGVRMGLPGRLSNPDVEKMLDVVREGKLVINDDDSGTTLDVATNEIHVSKKTYKTWRAMFWASLGFFEVDGDAEAVKRAQSISMALFKHALLTIFQTDLNDSIVVGKKKRIEVQFPPGSGGLVFEYTMGGPAGVYWPVRMERYRYVSDSATPMIVDMLRLNRAFQYHQLVSTSPTGKVIPYIPEKLMKRGDPFKMKKYLEANIRDLQTFVDGISNCKALFVEDTYPARVELKGDETMATCENCDRLEKELELLKAQLLEMKTVVLGSKRGKRIKRQLSGLGGYERRKIAEMLQEKKDEDAIVKELKVSERQIAAVKAWITMKGGFEEYFKWLDEKEAA